MNPKISVIILIYNAEKSIERCAISLFEQRFDSIEYIFVNDCTPDNSMSVLRGVMDLYPMRKSQIKIININKNVGQASARLQGIKASTGDYIIHCDSDDWVEPDMYRSLYLKAMETDSDVVVCDFLHDHYEHNRKYNRIEKYCPIHDPHECLLYKKSPVWWSLCNRIVKRELFFKYSIYPIPGLNMAEDFCVLMRIYYYANKISYIGVPLYHYNRDSETSIVQNKDLAFIKIRQFEENIKVVDEFFSNKELDMSEVLFIYKRNIRDRYLTLLPPAFNDWRHCFPEVLEKVMSDTTLSKLYRICYWWAAKGFFLPFKFYIEMSKKKNS